MNDQRAKSKSRWPDVVRKSKHNRDTYVGEVTLSKDIETPPPRLLSTPKPQSDESLMGYVLRLAEANGYKSASWIFDLARLKINVASGGSDALYRSDWDSTVLEQVTGLTRTEINNLNCRQIESLFPTLRVSSFNAFRYSSPKVCPACLAQENYCRSVWDLLPFTACPAHESVMMSLCPECGSRISWARKRVSVCRCGFDWRESVQMKASHQELEVSKLILALCGPSAEKVITIERANNPLQGLALDDICQALSLFANSFLFVKDGQRIRVETDNLTCHEAYCRAYDIFNDWPVNYHRFLQWVKRQEKTEIWYSNYYSRIAKEYDRRELHFILSATEDFIENNEVNPTCAILGSAPFFRRFLDITEACRRPGTEQVWLERLIRQGKIEDINKWGDSHILIDTESINKLYVSLAHLISTRLAARILNVPINDIESLVLEDCLSPARGPTVDGLPELRFEHQVINELLEKLRQRLPAHELTSRGKLISTSEVFHQLKIHRISPGQFIRAVIEGEIAPRTEMSSYRGLIRYRGLGRFHFLSVHVKKFIRKHRPKEKRLPTYIKYVTKFLKRKKEQNDRMFTNNGKEEISADVIGLQLMIKEIDVRRYSY